MTLLEKVKDLHKQSMTDRTHYYTRNVLEEVIAFLESKEEPRKVCINCFAKNNKVIEAIKILESV